MTETAQIPPIFIAIEGIDGCGKTTQVDELKKFLEARGRNVKTFANPGSSPLGLELRKLLLNKDLPASENALIAMFTVARLCVAEEITQAMQEGFDVIVDRYLLATMAYQGQGVRKVELKIQEMHDLLVGLYPDGSVLLEMQPRDAQIRLAATGKAPDRFESKKLQWHMDLALHYRHLAARSPWYWDQTGIRTFLRVVGVQASGTVAEVTAAIVSVLQAKHPYFKQIADLPAVQ